MRRSTDHLAPTVLFARRRGAFTLIELMIVIVIVGILMAFVLPAVMSSFRSARIAQVQTEMRGLEGAIAQFKTVYGIEPPSRIRLFETPAGWSTPGTGTTVDPTVMGGTLSNEAERVRSIGFINKLWPNFNFASTPGWDFNSDGTCSGYTTLYGAECLAFFLGGVPQGANGTGPFAMTGFSKNPANPFMGATGTESREGPYFEFKPSQLRKSTNPGSVNALVYVDPLPSQTAPYLYLSSYEGRGYQLADAYVKPPATYAPYPGNVNLLSIYRTAASLTSTPHKNKSFQLISAGSDGSYGSGGVFDASNSTTHGLTDKRDYDNITNFHTGVLK